MNYLKRKFLNCTCKNKLLNLSGKYKKKKPKKQNCHKEIKSIPQDHYSNIDMYISINNFKN